MYGVKSHVGIRVHQPGAWKVFGAESADSFGGDPESSRVMPALASYDTQTAETWFEYHQCTETGPAAGYRVLRRDVG